MAAQGGPAFRYTQNVGSVLKHLSFYPLLP
jgi:hypothetical protein